MRRLPRRVERLVKQAERKLAREVFAALSAHRASVSVERIEKAYRSQSAFAIHSLADGLKERLQRTVPTISKMFTLGVQTGREQLKREL